MNSKKILQLLALNISIAVVNLALFSKGMVGISFGESSVALVALGVTSIFMSVVVFFYGNYRLVLTKPIKIERLTLNSRDDLVEALKMANGKKTFQREMNLFLEQMERFLHKEETIHQVLLQKFDQTEMSFQKFDSTINAVEEVFYMNIRSVLNRLAAFDEDDYRYIQTQQAKRSLSQEVITTKMNIYNEYIQFVKQATHENESILLKLDRLLLEISKFSSLSAEELENMSAMKEIDALIDTTKYYK